MKPRTYSDEAVVLTRRSFSEADRIMSVFSKNHGRLSLIAKGIRKPSSRKRGHLEVFNWIRFAAVKGRNMDIMTEAEVVDAFSELKKDLKRVALAYYFMEVVGRTTHEGEPHLKLYDLLLEYLRKLAKAENLKRLRLNFAFNALTILGFWPKGKPLPNPDVKLEEIAERSFSSVRVGKRMLL